MLNSFLIAGSAVWYWNWELQGWGVRAGELISRGKFVCEYIGEVLNDQEANKRGER